MVATYYGHERVKNGGKTGAVPLATPSQEDYIEFIWRLVHTKGYACVTDLAEMLGISTASVSKMVRRLHHDGLLTYERYRGFNFTPQGLEQGQRLYERHRTLEKLFTHMAVGAPEEVYRLVEGIEHHLDAEVMRRIESLANYIQEHPEWWRSFLESTAGRDG